MFVFLKRPFFRAQRGLINLYTTARVLPAGRLFLKLAGKDRCLFVLRKGWKFLFTVSTLLQPEAVPFGHC